MPHIRAYKIITPRLHIRCYQPDDAAMLVKSVNESLPELLPWMPWAKYEPETVEAKRQRIERMIKEFEEGIDFTLGVFNHKESEVLGSTGMHTRVQGNGLEIGYWVNSMHTGKGICTEIAQALTKIGFELEGLDRMIIICDTKNTASARIPEKCGYTLAEVRKNHLTDVDGNPRDSMIWEMKREDYHAATTGSLPVRVFDKNGALIFTG